MAWYIKSRAHTVACGEPRDMVDEQFVNYHHEHDIDVCDDYEWMSYDDKEVMEALGHGDIL